MPLLAKRRAAAHRRRILVLLAGAACACAPLRPFAPVPRRGPAPVAVRLAAAEGQSTLELQTSSGPLTLRRRGARIEASDGRSGARVSVEAGARELGAFGRDYPGRLRVELRPEGGLRMFNELDIETYVAGVLASEVSLWSAEAAELAALAIAARTYARLAQERGATLWDDTRDQAYGGRFREASSARGDELADKLERAVTATRGQLLVEASGALVNVRYHASCGGHTADSARGAGVFCAPCSERAEAEQLAGQPDERRPLAWRESVDALTLAELARQLDLGARVTRLEPVRVDTAGRWLEIELRGASGARRIPFDRLRQLLGPASIKSALILRTQPRAGEAIGERLLLEGLGRGHGQGLCQEGARDLAAGGWSARRILEHYYPGARVRSGSPRP